ncbi:MAG: hypothetical protein R3C11_24240 [Planctomycetaceae bacterium]
MVNPSSLASLQSQSLVARQYLAAYNSVTQFDNLNLTFPLPGAVDLPYSTVLILATDSFEANTPDRADVITKDMKVI